MVNPTMPRANDIYDAMIEIPKMDNDALSACGNNPVAAVFLLFGAAE